MAISSLPRDKIVIECFDITTMDMDEDPDVAGERWLFDWFTRLLAKLKPNRVSDTMCGISISTT